MVRVGREECRGRLALSCCVEQSLQRGAAFQPRSPDRELASSLRNRERLD